MSDFNVDVSEIEKMLDKITPTQQRDIMLKAFKAGGELLKSKAREKLLQKFPGASTARGGAKMTMAEGIACFENEQFNSVTVSLTNRKHGANYLNKWFETGTGERVLKKDTKYDNQHFRTFKKGESRGKISAKNFFRDARQENSDKMIQLIEDEIIKALYELFE